MTKFSRFICLIFEMFFHHILPQFSYKYTTKSINLSNNQVIPKCIRNQRMYPKKPINLSKNHQKITKFQEIYQKIKLFLNQ